MPTAHKPSEFDAIVSPAQQTVLTHSAAQGAPAPSSLHPTYSSLLTLSPSPAGIQIASIVSPAYLTLTSFRRRTSPLPASAIATASATAKSPSRLTPLLRRHVVHSFVLGPLAGLAIGAGRMYVRPEAAGERALASEVKRDRAVRKAEDWAVIGGVLGAVSFSPFSEGVHVQENV